MESQRWVLFTHHLKDKQVKEKKVFKTLTNSTINVIMTIIILADHSKGWSKADEMEVCSKLSPDIPCNYANSKSIHFTFPWINFTKMRIRG